MSYFCGENSEIFGSTGVTVYLAIECFQEKIHENCDGRLFARIYLSFLNPCMVRDARFWIVQIL